MKRSLLIVLAAATACGGPARDVPVGAAPADPGPMSIILFIGDGTGLSAWDAARLASPVPLAIEQFPVVGLVDTQSTDSRITDSAAAATAYSTGVRTYNGAIGMAPDTTPVPTVLEIAEGDGWATGLVATSTLTHATPGSFAAHVESRNMHEAIAAGIADQDIDVLLGGGRQYFHPAVREDGENLLARIVGRGTYVEDAASFLALDMDTVRAPLVGLFAMNQLPPAPRRSPDLAQLTRGALQVLEKDRDGFFLMVEGSQIDWRAHENAPLRQVVAEVQDLDNAIREALEFQERRPNTLIVVTADHSTGGLNLHSDRRGVFRAHYTTEGHTAGMVPLFARGPNALSFGGITDNDEVGRLLLQLVRGGGAGSGP